MRSMVLVLGLLAGSTAGAAAADLFWISNKTDSGASAALVGCTECDDIALQLVCDRESKIVRINLYGNAAAEKPTGRKADLVRFHFGDKKTGRAAAYAFDEMNAAYLPVVTVNVRDPLLRRIRKAESLAIEANGRKAEISMKGAEQHVKAMRRGCR